MTALVANPYTILNEVPAEASHFTVIDLKDAFFSIPVNADHRDLFAFEWTDPGSRRVQKFRWTVLPMGFVHSPTIFAQVLGSYLDQIPSKEGTKLLQYVNDLLVASTSKADCKKETYNLLNHLGTWGYRAYPEKFQFYQQEVKYLGHILKKREKSLVASRIKVIQELTIPRTKRGLRGYLGVMGYCCPWIAAYGEMAKVLYAKLKKEETEPLHWSKEESKAFESLKQVVGKALPLGIPNYTKPFTLFVNERAGVASGFLTQKLGLAEQPVGYFLRQLDPVAKGMPGCIRAVAATAMLLEEANKITMGNP